jgi:hypothetical protein
MDELDQLKRATAELESELDRLTGQMASYHVSEQQNAIDTERVALAGLRAVRTASFAVLSERERAASSTTPVDAAGSEPVASETFVKPTRAE